MSKYEQMMPVSRPSLGQDELEEIRKVFDSNWLGMGRWVSQFEDAVKSYIGVRNVVAVNTGTSALHLALNAIGIKKKDQVILPSLTFAASVQAVLAAGADPVFCDVEENTLNMDVADVSTRVTDRTKAIMPVHYSGLPCDMDKILGLAKKHGLRVIEDAAHAFGSKYKGKKIGSFADITCFSFDPIKTITCGEGGAIATNDDKLAELIIKKRILGIDKDAWSRYNHKREWFYNVTTPGFRYHMSNINAAIGLVQMKKVDEFIRRRREVVKKYDSAFKSIPRIRLVERDYEDSAPFNYIIRFDKKRDELMSYMKERKIDSGVHYIPNHIQPLFSAFKTSLPITEKLWQEIITLPLYSDISDDDVREVIKAVRGFWNRYA